MTRKLLVVLLAMALTAFASVSMGAVLYSQDFNGGAGGFIKEDTSTTQNSVLTLSNGGVDGTNCLSIINNNAPEEEIWRVRFLELPLPVDLETGKSYRYTIYMRAIPRDGSLVRVLVKAKIANGASPYQNLGLNQEAYVSKDWECFSWVFTVNDLTGVDREKIRQTIDVAWAEGSYFIDSIKIEDYVPVVPDPGDDDGDLPDDDPADDDGDDQDVNILSLPYAEGFSSNTGGWTLEDTSTTQGAKLYDSSSRCLLLENPNPPGEARTVRAQLRGLPLEEGKTYEVCLSLGSSQPATVKVKVSNGASPYQNLGLNEEVQLGQDWQYLCWTFTASGLGFVEVNPKDIRLTVDVGLAPGYYYVDDVVIREVITDDDSDDDADDDDGTQPPRKHGGGGGGGCFISAMSFL